MRDSPAASGCDPSPPAGAPFWRAAELVGHYALLAAFVCGPLFLHPLSWGFAVASTLLAGAAEFRLGRCDDLTGRTPPGTRARALGALAAVVAGTAAAIDGASAEGLVAFQVSMWLASAYGGWRRFADLRAACHALEIGMPSGASAPPSARRAPSAIGDA
jgi:hypothetical protein